MFKSNWLTLVLIALIICAMGIEAKIKADARARDTAGEKAWDGAYRTAAIAHAIEQYCYDFPDADVPSNTRKWIDQLAGQNEKGIRYLKVEKFGRDTSGQLLDPQGKPWVIEVPDSAGFQQMVTPGSADEFHVRSIGYPGLAIGYRHHPKFPRS
jgi:hypothetical protein